MKSHNNSEIARNNFRKGFHLINVNHVKYVNKIPPRIFKTDAGRVADKQQKLQVQNPEDVRFLSYYHKRCEMEMSHGSKWYIINLFNI